MNAAERRADPRRALPREDVPKRTYLAQPSRIVRATNSFRSGMITVRDVYEILRQKEMDCARLQKELEAQTEWSFWKRGRGHEK